MPIIIVGLRIKQQQKKKLVFANEAKKNGLDANTVMVNDAEQKEINNGRLTENSLYFSATLKMNLDLIKLSIIVWLVGLLHPL